MATRNQGKGNQGNQQQGDDDNQGGSNVIVEQEMVRRIRVGAVTYESHSGNTEGIDEEHITVTAEGQDPTQLNAGDVDVLARFFGRVVRYNANQQRRGGQGATDGRGQVNHPGTDSRLRGNEDLRPGDPGGARRAGQANQQSGGNGNRG